MHAEKTLNVELQFELFDFCAFFFGQQITYYLDDVLMREI